MNRNDIDATRVMHARFHAGLPVVAFAHLTDDEIRAALSSPPPTTWMRPTAPIVSTPPVAIIAAAKDPPHMNLSQAEAIASARIARSPVATSPRQAEAAPARRDDEPVGPPRKAEDEGDDDDAPGDTEEAAAALERLARVAPAKHRAKYLERAAAIRSKLRASKKPDELTSAQARVLGNLRDRRRSSVDVLTSAYSRETPSVGLTSQQSAALARISSRARAR
jgi:hypothetical protein